MRVLPVHQVRRGGGPVTGQPLTWRIAAALRLIAALVLLNLSVDLLVALVVLWQLGFRDAVGAVCVVTCMASAACAVGGVQLLRGRTLAGRHRLPSLRTAAAIRRRFHQPAFEPPYETVRRLIEETDTNA